MTHPLLLLPFFVFPRVILASAGRAAVAFAVSQFGIATQASYTVILQAIKWPHLEYSH